VFVTVEKLSPTLVSRRAGNDVSPFLRILTTAPRIDLDPAGPTVSVIIPTRNEEQNLRWVARHMPANTHEIILVDGGSTDGTVETARALWPQVRVLHQTRRGKGNALACGFHAATGDVLVMIDADGSMDPGEIPYFVEALRDGADYAKGSRFTSGGGSSDITALRAWGNRRLNGVTAMVHGTMYSDLCYGFNAFWRHLLPVLDLDPGAAGEQSDERLWGDGFEVETLINIRVHAAGVRIAEVPSFEHERLYGLSNLNTFRDGLRVLRTIALEKVVRRRHAERVAGWQAGVAAVTGAGLTASVFPDAASDDPSVPLSADALTADPVSAVVLDMPAGSRRPARSVDAGRDRRLVAPGVRTVEDELDAIAVELADADEQLRRARIAS